MKYLTRCLHCGQLFDNWVTYYTHVTKTCPLAVWHQEKFASRLKEANKLSAAPIIVR